MRAARLASKCRNRAVGRGFTLVELLTVVAITGILATIGTMLVRKHFASAKTTEAVALIQAIRTAEESRRAESGTYQNCSFTSGTPWYPASPDGNLHAWQSPSHPDWDAWKQLDISRPEGTQFGFLVHAGNPQTAVDPKGDLHAVSLPVPQTADRPTWPAQTEPWYVIQAAGDRDKDGTFSRLLAASFNGELYVENDGE
jgi:type IV pilus assembly protein PilA